MGPLLPDLLDQCTYGCGRQARAAGPECRQCYKLDNQKLNRYRTVSLDALPQKELELQVYLKWLTEQ